MLRQPASGAAGGELRAGCRPGLVGTRPVPGAGTRTSENIQAAFAGIASLSDQSHGRVLFRVAGPKALDMLAKVSSLDLDPLVFPAGSAAMTSIDHTGVTLWRELGDTGGPVYNLLVFTSFAETLWRLLVDFGCRIRGGIVEQAFLMRVCCAAAHRFLDMS